LAHGCSINRDDDDLFSLSMEANRPRNWRPVRTRALIERHCRPLV
jgi:hypothetical protein